MKDLRESENRREFFLAGLRYVVTGVMAVAGGVCLAKRRRVIKEYGCVNQSLCSGCEVLRSCKLPRGISAREVLGKD